MSNFYEKMIKRLTDNYNKSSKSNISKLLQIVGEELDDIKITYRNIEEWRDIDKAEGKALDDIGKNYMQFRGQVSDDIYRVLIRSRIARNKATGTYNNMVEVLSLALQVDPSEIVIEEGDTEYHSIRIIQIPLDKLTDIGMSTTVFGRLVAKLTAAGVGVRSIEFYGTFDYGEELEVNSDIGYADIDMTTGGTLGDLYQPGVDPEFPL